MSSSKRIKLQLLILLFTVVSFQLTAATVTWDGGASTTNWMDAANWDTDMIPTAADDVDLDGNTVVLSASTTVQRVYAGGSSNLTIDMSVVLNITGFLGTDDGLEVQNSATVINNGTIAISNINVGNTDADGLYNKGTFTNNGSITITMVGQHGMYLQQGTFTNSTTGTITITNTGQGDTGADYIYMDDNSGTGAIFHNHGEVDITMTGNDDGIYIKDGSSLTNHSTGEIEIISTGGGDMPLHLVGNVSVATATTLTNNGTFTINVSGASDYGVQIDGDDISPVATIINSGTFTILNGTNDAIRIRRGGAFTNSTGGTLTITEPGDEAIQIDGEANTEFNNSGTVDITGKIANTGNHGIELLGTFNNLAGGVLTVTACGSDGMRVQSSGVFVNDGDINMYGSFDNDIELTTGGTFTNSGTATFSPGSTAASTYGITNIKKDFDLGSATVTFQIGGTTAGTEHDQIENKDNANTITITGATAHLDWGAYVPAINDEFKIVDESGTVAGPFASVTSSNSDIIFTVDYATNTDEVKIVVTNIVPVEMTYFIGEQTTEGNLLKWETASEENNAGFEVQKSTDTKNWEAIDFVEGNGTSWEVNNYNYLDENVTSNVNYYRLKQNDFDGKFDYSNVISIVNDNQQNDIKTYPNPVKNQLTVDGFVGTVTVYNLLGQPLKTFNVTNEVTTLSLSNLENGQYFIEMIANDGTKTIRQIVKIAE